jgi:aspartate/methionine/tyrosine aminotransferase
LALMRYELDLPSLELANRLAENYGVMLAPGSAFDYEGYLRIGIGNDQEIFAEGLRQTARCLRDLADAGVPLRSERLAVARV